MSSECGREYEPGRICRRDPNHGGDHSRVRFNADEQPEDRPANVRDLPVELQDLIQDVTAFYLDTTEDDFLEEPEENPIFREAQALYHDLTGAWRDRGQDVYTEPEYRLPESAH